jgi:hypothetical protein
VTTGDLPSGCTAFSSLGASLVARVTEVRLDLVGEPKLLQEPQDTLGTGVVEMVDYDHGASSCGYRQGVQAAVIGHKLGV